MVLLDEEGVVAGLGVLKELGPEARVDARGLDGLEVDIRGAHDVEDSAELVGRRGGLVAAEVEVEGPRGGSPHRLAEAVPLEDALPEEERASDDLVALLAVGGGHAKGEARHHHTREERRDVVEPVVAGLVVVLVGDRVGTGDGRLEREEVVEESVSREARSLVDGRREDGARLDLASRTLARAVAGALGEPVEDREQGVVLEVGVVGLTRHLDGEVDVAKSGLAADSINMPWRGARGVGGCGVMCWRGKRRYEAVRGGGGWSCVCRG